MSIAQALLPEFDQEMSVTRTLLERVPTPKNDWAPHRKSMTLGRLAGHVATLLNWTQSIVHDSEFDVASPAMEGYEQARFDTVEALLAAFDDNVAKARATIADASDETLLAPWSLKRGSDVVFALPRAAVLRTMVFNHLIHHRGQLSVYLRLQDVPLPSIYGPSADTAV